MTEYAIREYRGGDDARRQYELWLQATAELPRAWRSCLRNVEYQHEQAKRCPRSRLFAEGADGRLIGYIGTHPPFEWLASQHGPPAKSLGWAIPFGFPWTFPYDAALEVALYDEMIRSVPQVYADSKRDIYIQRFRESWSQHLGFLERRGWRRHDRLPLVGRSIGSVDAASDELVVVARDDLSLVSSLIEADETAAEKSTAADLERKYDGGWIVSDTFWRLGTRGAFAIEQRGPWAAVTLFAAEADAWDETLQAVAAKAGSLGVKEIYFTIDANDGRLRAALEDREFREVDAGVFYVRDAD